MSFIHEIKPILNFRFSHGNKPWEPEVDGMLGAILLAVLLLCAFESANQGVQGSTWDAMVGMTMLGAPTCIVHMVFSKPVWKLLGAFSGIALACIFASYLSIASLSEVAFWATINLITFIMGVIYIAWTISGFFKPELRQA